MVKAHYLLSHSGLPYMWMDITKSTNTIAKLEQTGQAQSEEEKAKHNILSTFIHLKDYDMEEGLGLLASQDVEMGSMGGSIGKSNQAC